MHAVQINLFTANKYSQHLLKVGRYWDAASAHCMAVQFNP